MQSYIIKKNKIIIIIEKTNKEKIKFHIFKN